MTTRSRVEHATHVARSRFGTMEFRAAADEQARSLRDEADQRLLGEWIVRARLEQEKIDRDVATGRTFVVAGDDVVHTLECPRTRPLLDRHGLVRTWITRRFAPTSAVPELYHRCEVLRFFDSWRPCELCEPELGDEQSTTDS
jgi:hypothetical protein